MRLKEPDVETRWETGLPARVETREGNQGKARWARGAGDTLSQMPEGQTRQLTGMQRGPSLT